MGKGLYAVLLCTLSVAARAHLGTQVHSLWQPGAVKPLLLADGLESGRLAGGAVEAVAAGLRRAGRGESLEREVIRDQAVSQISQAR